MRDLVAKLENYKSNVKTRTIRYNAHNIKYYVLGEDKTDTILFLPGGSGVCTPFF